MSTHSKNRGLLQSASYRSKKRRVGSPTAHGTFQSIQASTRVALASIACWAADFSAACRVQSRSEQVLGQWPRMWTPCRAFCKLRFFKLPKRRTDGQYPCAGLVWSCLCSQLLILLTSPQVAAATCNLIRDLQDVLTR